MVDEFEESDKASDCNLHHEQTPSTQRRFIDQVRSLATTIEEMGNPFMEESDDLLVLDTREMVVKEVRESVRNIKDIGQRQYSSYTTARLIGNTPITDTIPKNKLPLFSAPTSRTPNQKKSQLSMYKRDCSLFSRLYIACQSREGKLADFFAHENQNAPPSLSQGGALRSGKKSDIVKCLTADQMTTPPTLPSTGAVILDGSAVIHMLQPKTAKTFRNYASEIFRPFIENILKNTRRVDTVFDVYKEGSLKASTRERRGTGKRRRIDLSTLVPVKHWKNFLCVDENKTELFALLAQVIVNIDVGEKEVLVTLGSDVLTNHQMNMDDIRPCSHEEADARLLLHAKHAAQNGATKIAIRSVDSDVVVIAVSTFMELGAEELWLHYGTGHHQRILPIHEISSSLSPAACRTLPMFHALTGCDTVSSFAGRGKKTAWNIWKEYDEVTTAFEECMTENHLSDISLALIERYVILLYDRFVLYTLYDWY